MEKKAFTYWSLTILLNYIPTILVHYFVRPMWYKGVHSHTSATILEFSFTMFFLPIYLIFVNYLLAKKYNKLTELFFLNAMMIISCIIISTQLHLKNWSDSIGSAKPDGETKGVMNFACFVGVCICLLAFVVIYFNVRRKNKKLNHTDPVLK
jgi:hypothetical protein